LQEQGGIKETGLELRQGEGLVGRMDAIRLQAEADQQRLGPRDLGKTRYDRDGGPLPQEGHRLAGAKRRQRSLRRADGGGIRIEPESRTTDTRVRQRQAHAGRRVAGKMRGNRVKHSLRCLAGNQTGGQLEFGGGRDDGLHAAAAVAAVDAVDIQAGQKADPLIGREFAHSAIGAGAGLAAIGVRIEWDGGGKLRLAGRGWNDAIVETGDGDASLGIEQQGGQLRYPLRRVGGETAVHPRMEIVVSPVKLRTEVDNPAEAHDDGRSPGLHHAGVVYHQDVGLESFAPAFEHAIQPATAAFLLALDQHLEVDIQRSALDQGLDRGQRVEDLPLVVLRPAREKPAAPPGRLEWRRGPGTERIDRLNIVMPVEKHRGPVGLARTLREDEGFRAGRGQFGVKAVPPQARGDPVGTIQTVLLARRIGTDTRETQKRLPVLHNLLPPPFKFHFKHSYIHDPLSMVNPDPCRLANIIGNDKAIQGHDCWTLIEALDYCA